jgi:hypothetical protein
MELQVLIKYYIFIFLKAYSDNKCEETITNWNVIKYESIICITRLEEILYLILTSTGNIVYTVKLACVAAVNYFFIFFATVT